MSVAAIAVLLAMRMVSNEASTIITFPTSFTSLEHERIGLLDIKHEYQKGIDAVQSVAGLVQNILLQETINIAANNWIISPVSLAGVFAQLLMGSRGEIREILSEALAVVDDGKDVTKLEMHRQLGNLLYYLQRSKEDEYLLLSSSVVFLQNGFPLKTTYKHALWDFYRTPIVPIDLSKNYSASMRKINDWVRNATKNKFTDLMTLPLSPNTVSIMASVVYFKGSWEMPFDPDYTQPGVFFLDKTRQVQVDYMYGEQEVLYGNTSDYQLVGLPFKTREIVLYIVLPNGRFSSKVAIQQFNEIASSARLENVTIALPKIKLSTTISVKDAITKYLRKKSQSLHQRSLTEKFSKNSTKSNEFPKHSFSMRPPNVFKSPLSASKKDYFDMSGASDDVRFKIDDILHKVSIQMDELGTELVAVTSTLVDHSGNDFIIKVNRPFMFFLRHEVTMTHLFWGFITNPTISTVNSVQKRPS